MLFIHSVYSVIQTIFNFERNVLIWTVQLCGIEWRSARECVIQAALALALQRVWKRRTRRWWSILIVLVAMLDGLFSFFFKKRKFFCSINLSQFFVYKQIIIVFVKMIINAMENWYLYVFILFIRNYYFLKLIFFISNSIGMFN